MKNLNKFKLIKIGTIETVHLKEPTMVYDLSVEKDNSYTANKIIVHNCSTSVHTGVGFPMASLIKECYKESCKLKNPAFIVADGGMQNYGDIIKALALGADFVMLGGMFNKSLESSGDNYIFKYFKVSQKNANLAYKLKIPVYKKYRGMSTKEVQKKWKRERLVSSEGVTRYRRVEYTLKQWVDNFEDYLRSSMSYSNAMTLDEFIGKCDIIKISDNSYKRYKK